MEKFGFSILKARHINYDSNDKSIAEYISEREPSFRICIECGCCTATCTTGNFTRFSLRELQILLKRGENESVREVINKCMLCGKCTLACPRGVNTRNVILLAREAFQKRLKNAV
ncbi:MAG TPA: 4Fe-4S dicluster domain-containing protein [Bacteroidales bacterium]|jgi:heterodisulfide reductase subunit B|nr:4Fe-4S dicluster domain-containing protein [Bacteroidales bacterium]HOX73864.1 4Fe-4S dicluster domain-containing protein [Bacteroidales bacterium]HPM88120.1 4Fe-4S dicluster domain-containing protein [Bacteroidales bacterium]HQM68296.1 4Fe-4S dicluster domain-containing protein [Bacteroidales bacterium]